MLCPVFKYGAKTKLTCGFVQLLPTEHVKIEDIILATGVHTNLYYHQIKVLSTDGPFCEGGDSGSLVFIQERKNMQNPILRCIGMVVGVSSDGSGIVTPIDKVLESFSLKRDCLISPRTPVQIPGTSQDASKGSSHDTERIFAILDKMNSKIDKIDGISNDISDLKDSVEQLTKDNFETKNSVGELKLDNVRVQQQLEKLGTDSLNK